MALPSSSTILAQPVFQEAARRQRGREKQGVTLCYQKREGRRFSFFFEERIIPRRFYLRIDRWRLLAFARTSFKPIRGFAAKESAMGAALLCPRLVCQRELPWVKAGTFPQASRLASQFYPQALLIDLEFFFTGVIGNRKRRANAKTAIRKGKGNLKPIPAA